MPADELEAVCNSGHSYITVYAYRGLIANLRISTVIHEKALHSSPAVRVRLSWNKMRDHACKLGCIEC